MLASCHAQPRGDIVLHSSDKERNSTAPDTTRLRRRDFLIRCCQAASTALLPGIRGIGFFPFFNLNRTATESANREYHLHPHYRMAMPLDALLLKSQSGLDGFVTEQYADEIVSILADWSSGLRESPQNLKAVENVLSPDFMGVSLHPSESRIVRRGPAVEVRQLTFK